MLIFNLNLYLNSKVENEYGSYYACDSNYKLWLRDLFKSYIKNNALLYTIDICEQKNFDCGPIPEVYATVDFGISSNGKYSFTYVIGNHYNHTYCVMKPILRGKIRLLLSCVH